MRLHFLALLLACGDSSATGDASTDANTEASDDAGSADASADVATGCVIQVATSGQDSPTCGKTSPCKTITQGLANAQSGCKVSVGPGTYDGASGEKFPLNVPAGVELEGSGDATIISEPTAGLNDVHTISCPSGGGAIMRGTVTMTGPSKLSKVKVHGPQQTPTAVSVLVLDGVVEIFDATIEYGGEGIYLGGMSEVSIHDVHLSHAGHAAIKPASRSKVTVDKATIFQSKDAVEPICDAITTVSNSEVYCNGNGLEALANANTTLENNSIHHNSIGIAARGDGTRLVAHGNTVKQNKFGAIEIFGLMELGTKTAPGNNTITGNQYAGVTLQRAQVSMFAVGNTWAPSIDGADTAGLFTGAVEFSAPKCPNTPFGTVENPPDPSCVGNETVVPTSYQNVVVDDGTCSGGSASTTGKVIVSVP